jgi:hypothetical protein
MMQMSAVVKDTYLSFLIKHYKLQRYRCVVCGSKKYRYFRSVDGMWPEKIILSKYGLFRGGK